ncbi:hypothetical protein E2320_016895 [Naja naja]|nr:hypothetical protein E2320_016895 [Naja naja]
MKATIVSSPRPLQFHVYSKERRISGLHEILICDIFQDVGIDTSGESRNGSNRLVKVSSNAFLPVVVPKMHNPGGLRGSDLFARSEVSLERPFSSRCLWEEQGWGTGETRSRKSPRAALLPFALQRLFSFAAPQKLMDRPPRSTGVGS